MSVFVLEGITAPTEKKPKRPSRKKKPAAEPSTEPAPSDLASRYHELLNQHVELADRYEQVVTNYEQLLDVQRKLADQIRHLSQ